MPHYNKGKYTQRVGDYTKLSRSLRQFLRREDWRLVEYDKRGLLRAPDRNLELLVIPGYINHRNTIKIQLKVLRSFPKTAPLYVSLYKFLDQILPSYTHYTLTIDNNLEL